MTIKFSAALLATLVALSGCASCLPATKEAHPVECFLIGDVHNERF